MNDLISANQQIQEELQNSKIKQEKLISDKSIAEDELVKIKMLIEEESLRRE
jgi:hypothetical protein